MNLTENQYFSQLFNVSFTYDLQFILNTYFVLNYTFINNVFCESEF